MHLMHRKKQIGLVITFIVIIFIGVLFLSNTQMSEENKALHVIQSVETHVEEQDIESSNKQNKIENKISDKKNSSKEENTIKEEYRSLEEVNSEVMDKKETLITEEKDFKVDAATEYKNNQTIKSNQLSQAPIKQETYIVSRGDTLSQISRRANLTIKELKEINDIENDNIYEGQQLSTKKTKEVNSQEVNINKAEEDTQLNEDAIFWLSRIIHAEAQGESYQGKVAVGNVILNRVGHSDFPNTIYGVIFDVQYGYVQFSPVLDGNIYNTPNADSVRAAQEVLNGARPVGDVLYFLNPRKATNFWIVENREFYMTIDDHDFYF
ncbi:cell wall hydrolase [Serpentinicella sp. ANB-PHB4]|uniref:cell wall hydrolase n=1 Tax=Serpentinicella sp. ANB-PHB4 TaxID=3074076 RepID=UPI002856A32D|nr:cell wall hydrolase [Serpentinicella sp. ANB-PHB4]MDR5658345.1 cell wall hydrolase [Serpentinicella sp. ANB-PHB4]